jgi:transcriptional regulator with XRE-family HTH domain
VPRPNPPRSLQSEDNLARRVAYEREQRGWTYDGLAKRLTEAGCSIQGSAIYKIEKGTPRRRISVDELVAFAEVFEVNVADLLIPLELMAEQKVVSLIADLRHRYAVLVARVDEMQGTVEEIATLAGSVSDERRHLILQQLWDSVIDVASERQVRYKESENVFGQLITRIHQLAHGSSSGKVTDGEHRETS